MCNLESFDVIGGWRYGTSDWMTLEESVYCFLQLTGNSPTLIPHIPEEPAKQNPPVRFAYSPAPDTSRDEALASDALRCISPDVGYETWLKTGQALHSYCDHLITLLIELSQGSKDFDEAECRNGSSCAYAIRLTEDHFPACPVLRLGRRQRYPRRNPFMDENPTMVLRVQSVCSANDRHQPMEGANVALNFSALWIGCR